MKPDYYDSQFDDWDDERDYHESESDDRFEWGCCFPDKCLMAYTDHMRDECHTVEMIEEYEQTI